MIKRFMYLGLSAAMTALMAMVLRKLTAFAYTRATGARPPED
jgi:hypothetical protein